MDDKPTKEFLINQIKACEIAIYQNQGAINLIKAFLENEIYLKEEASDGSANTGNSIGSIRGNSIESIPSDTKAKE